MAELSAGLRIIIADTERLRNLAKGDGEDFLAYLLEQALHEARAIAGGRGQEIPPAVPEELPENVAAMPRRRR